MESREENLDLSVANDFVLDKENESPNTSVVFGSEPDNDTINEAGQLPFQLSLDPEEHSQREYRRNRLSRCRGIMRATSNAQASDVSEQVSETSNTRDVQAALNTTNFKRVHCIIIPLLREKPEQFFLNCQKCYF